MVTSRRGYKSEALLPWRKEITELRTKGFSYQEISNHLNNKGICVSYKTISRFLKN
jgi:arginine repressor